MGKYTDYSSLMSTVFNLYLNQYKLNCKSEDEDNVGNWLLCNAF